MLLAAGNAYASGAEVTVGSVVASENSEVYVPIELSGNPGVMALQILIEYDDALTLTGVVQGTALSGFTFTTSGSFDTCPYNLIWDGMANDSSNGTLATLVFQAPAERGIYSVRAYSEAGYIYNYDMDDVDVRFTNGQVNVGGIVPVSGVSLTDSAIEMRVGDTRTVQANITPSNATNKAVSWQSSDSSVAAVDSNGTVTAVSAGSAEITVTTDDGSYSAAFTVTVSEGSDSVVDSGVDSNGISWQLSEDGVLSFAGTGAMEDYAKATSIPWYDYRGDIVEVIFGDGITHIAARALYNCTGLAKATVPSTVTSIGTQAFSRCDDVVFYGYKGSYAEEYAGEYEIEFVEIVVPSILNTPEVDFAQTSKKWYFDVTLADCNEEGNVYLAFYDSQDRLLKVMIEEFAADDITSFESTKLSGASYYGIFILKENQEPLSKPYIGEFN